MFSYRCPSCGKQHAAEKEPEATFTTKCLRCGWAIDVPGRARAKPPGPPADGEGPVEETGTQGLKQAITTRRAVGKREKSAEEDGEAEEAAPVGKRAPKAEEGPKKKRALKGSKGKAESLPEEEEEERPAPVSRKGSWKGRALVAGIVLLVVGGVGVGGYLVFGKKGAPVKTASPKKKPAPKAKTSPAKADKETAKDKVVKKAPPITKGPLVKKKPNATVWLSAARLAAEHAADPAETNRKYKGVVMEVSGRVANTVMEDLVYAPKRTHISLATEGLAVGFDLAATEGPQPAKRWRAPDPGQLLTLRGTYGKDGLLTGGEMRPISPSADPRYKGKEIELAGHVAAVHLDQDFPILQLESDTDSQVKIHCFFRKTEREDVLKVPVGAPVIVRGTCNGRHARAEGEVPIVRMDNSQIVTTSAPVPPAPRLDAVLVGREYEEDLRPVLRLPPGKEPLLPTLRSIAELEREQTADSKVLEKYRNKVLILSGYLQQKTGHLLTLKSGDTDQALTVRCYFSPRHFQEVEGGPAYRVRGLCTGLLGPRLLRLDNCEIYDPERSKDTRRLTADFLPHVPGQNQTYDVAVFSPFGKGGASVIRQDCYQRANGITEVVVTHMGKLTAKGLFAPDAEKWVHQKKIKKGRLPWAPSYHRIKGGMVEIGHRLPGKAKGELITVWEPVLKIGARVGNSWRWAHDNVDRRYALLKFDTYHGRTAAILTETVTHRGSPEIVEVRHVYVQGVGEVEREEHVRLTSRESRLVKQKRLVEDPRAVPIKGPKVPAPKEPKK